MEWESGEIEEEWRSVRGGKKKKKGIKSGNSLAIQWLGRSTFTTEPGSIPGQGTKIPYAAQSFKKYPREGFKTNKQTNTTT